MRHTIANLLILALLLNISSIALGQPEKIEANVAAATKLKAQLAEQLQTGRRWAFLVGVDRYKEIPLRFCGRDVVLLKETLIRSGSYQEETIISMTDTDPDPAMHPTSDNIKRQLQKALSYLKPGDTFLFSFSGHGSFIANRCYLCPLDIHKGELSVFLKLDEIRDQIVQSSASQKILLIDCCHSAAVQAKPDEGAGDADVVSGPFELAQGCITFTACRSHEESAESGNEQQGVFTLSLCRGLEGAADFDSNGIVDSDEVYRHVLSEVPAGARAIRPQHKQTPVRVIGPDVVGLFAMCETTPVKDRKRHRRYLQPGDSITNSIGMKLTMLPNGMTLIGSPKDEYRRGDDEQSEPVILTDRVTIGTHEVTQREYAEVMGENPSYFSAEGAGANQLEGIKSSRFPVEQVSWADAVEFCNRLSQVPAEAAAGRVYRLPSEAEWEFACRGNSTLAFSVGEVIEATQANIRADRPYWYAEKVEPLGRPRLVGSYAPNAFGLHDMHGNVAEWTYDFYTPDRIQGFYDVGLRTAETSADMITILEEVAELGVVVAQGDPTPPGKFDLTPRLNPSGPRVGQEHVVRGGSYFSDVADCRSAARRSHEPDYKHRALGFRVVCLLQKPVYLD